MDICKKLDIPDNSVDLIIDKGCMDAILCGEDYHERVNLMLNQCYRMLKPKGTLMVLS